MNPTPTGSDNSSLRITVKDVGGEPTLFVSGEIDYSSSPAFKSAINVLCNRIRQRLIVDLSSVSFMDSSGLHALLEAVSTMRARDGEVVLVNPTHNILRMLEISGTASGFVIEIS